MSKNSAISHDDAVIALATFDAEFVKVQRKAVKRLGRLSLDNEFKAVTYADKMVKSTHGFAVKDIFAPKP